VTSSKSVFESDAPSRIGRELDLRYYALTLRRRWWLIVAVLFVFVGASAVLTIRSNKVYEAQTRLFVGQQAFSRQEIQFAQSLTQTSLDLVASYATVIRARPIAESVIRQLQLNESPDTLLASVSATPEPNTQIIDLRVTDQSPSRATDIANAIAHSFIASLARIDPSGSGRPAVQVSVFEPAVDPTTPISPKPIRNAAAGFLLGSVLALGVVILAERLDSTLKGRYDVEEASGLPVLSVIPHVKTPRGHILNQAGTPAGEAFRTLRSAVQYAVEDARVRVIAVTSPESADGKTSTAFNLAMAFAEAGVDACVVEADLRNPSLAKNLRLPAKVGLSDCLAGRAPLDGVILRASRPHMYLVPAGARTDKAPELFATARMSLVVSELRRRVRIVVIDTPPVLGVSDPVTLAPIVDGYIFVVRSGKTRAEHLRESVRILDGVGATMFGIVVNDLSRSSGLGYGYGYYGYGYGPSRAAASPNGEPGIEFAQGRSILAPRPMPPRQRLAPDVYEGGDLPRRPDGPRAAPESLPEAEDDAEFAHPADGEEDAEPAPPPRTRRATASRRGTRSRQGDATKRIRRLDPTPKASSEDDESQVLEGPL